MKQARTEVGLQPMRVLHWGDKVTQLEKDPSTKLEKH